MVDASGNTVVGDYDLVPILERFIAQNPDFSYRGARATLALTGYNGLFGYRTHPKAATYFGEAAYQQDIQDATAVANALREAGYKLAFYTYENVPYGDYSVSQIKADLNDWVNEAVPILGGLDMLVYAQMSDITADAVYSGEKYETLRDAGFRYYLGFCNNGTPWTTVTNDYVRQGRIMVSGSNMAHHADWFAAMFDSTAILDASRGTVPN
jgi:ABC-type transport system substrate-binding protein